MAAVNVTSLTQDDAGSFMRHLEALFAREKWYPGGPIPVLYLTEFNSMGHYNPLDTRMVLGCQFYAWGARQGAIMQEPLVYWLGSTDLLLQCEVQVREWARWMCRIARKREEHGLDPWGQTENGASDGDACQQEAEEGFDEVLEQRGQQDTQPEHGADQ